jgi:hypothetical protein
MASMTEVPRAMNQTNVLIVMVSPLVLSQGLVLVEPRAFPSWRQYSEGTPVPKVVMMREKFDVEGKQQG